MCRQCRTLNWENKLGYIYLISNLFLGDEIDEIDPWASNWIGFIKYSPSVMPAEEEIRHIKSSTISHHICNNLSQWVPLPLIIHEAISLYVNKKQPSWNRPRDMVLTNVSGGNMIRTTPPFFPEHCNSTVLMQNYIHVLALLLSEEQLLLFLLFCYHVNILDQVSSNDRQIIKPRESVSLLF